MNHVKGIFQVFSPTFFNSPHIFLFLHKGYCNCLHLLWGDTCSLFVSIDESSCFICPQTHMAYRLPSVLHNDQ